MRTRTRTIMAITTVVLTAAVLWPPPERAATPAEPAPELVLPTPPGEHAVGTQSMSMVDAERPDQFAPDRRPRALMVQFWYPAGPGGTEAPYATPAVLAFQERESGLAAGDLRVRTHARESAPILRRAGGWPVLLFSPGIGSVRALYTTMAEGLASAGYVVVAVDHPYDADLIEYPDGSTVSHEPDLWQRVPELLGPLLGARVADMTFVLNELVELPRFSGQLNLGRVGMYGHSLGGATAAQILVDDDRVMSAVNMDGPLYGSVLERGLDRPFLVIGKPAADPSLAAIWPRIRGPKWDLRLAGAGHMTFSDAVLLHERWDVTDRWPDGLLGTLDGFRAAEIVTAYLIAFFDHTLGGDPAPLLDASGYPEVSLHR